MPYSDIDFLVGGAEPKNSATQAEIDEYNAAKALYERGRGSLFGSKSVVEQPLYNDYQKAKALEDVNALASNIEQSISPYTPEEQAQAQRDVDKLAYEITHPKIRISTQNDTNKNNISTSNETSTNFQSPAAEDWSGRTVEQQRYYLQHKDDTPLEYQESPLPLIYQKAIQKDIGENVDINTLQTIFNREGVNGLGDVYDSMVNTKKFNSNSGLVKESTPAEKFNSAVDTTAQSKDFTDLVSTPDIQKFNFSTEDIRKLATLKTVNPKAFSTFIKTLNKTYLYDVTRDSVVNRTRMQLDKLLNDEYRRFILNKNRETILGDNYKQFSVDLNNDNYDDILGE